ncbi:MAG: membrane protein insertase YidC [Spirochaetales bacterium]|nr:membrane protein insertase YidC [Spirochaetales bacterium]
MDKRTILALVISVGIFIIYILVQMFLGGKQPSQIDTTQTITRDSEITREESETETGYVGSIVPVESEGEILLVSDELKDIKINKYTVTFSQKGALITHLKLNDYYDLDENPNDDIKPELIDMVVSEKSDVFPFTLFFGEYNTAKDVFLFNKEKSSETEYWFSKKYEVREKNNSMFFILTKIFSFKDPYIVDLTIMLESVDNYSLPLNFEDTMYTLTFGPQIGPKVEKIDNNNIEIRKYLYYAADKRKDITGKVKDKKFIIDKDISWAAIEGKYFVVIADPPRQIIENNAGFDTTNIPGLFARSSMFFFRSYEKRQTINEEFKFYIGPKIKDILKSYSKNDFQKVISENIFFDWIVVLLRWLLTFLYGIIRNWGVAIIVMTIIIKIVFFPLTQKGFKSTTKMQELNPKIEEIKARYKDNAQKMQAEIAALYKAHNINPLAGCLPWLIQIPIFIGLFTMLRDQFELRGAVFISGWINDLSSPENLFRFPFSIPFVNWTHLNILPFVMTGMMFVQQKFTQTPTASAGSNQMKILLYAMPIMFFVICYNMPSGVVLYWTVQSLISFFQQIFTNTMQKKKKKENIPETMKGNVIKKKRK